MSSSDYITARNVVNEFLDECDLFLGEDGRGYVTIYHDRCGRETHPLRSSDFASWIAAKYLDEQHQQISGQYLTQILAEKSRELLAEKPEFKPVVNRLGFAENSLFIDLGDRQSTIVVNSRGCTCEMTNGVEPCLAFLANHDRMALPEPDFKTEALEPLAEILSLDEYQFLLTLIWLLCSLGGLSRLPLLAITGGAHSGTSAIANVLRDLTDPMIGPLQSLPTASNAIPLQAASRFVMAYGDIYNLSPQPRRHSRGSH